MANMADLAFQAEIDQIVASDAGAQPQCLCASVPEEEVCPVCFGAAARIGMSPRGVATRARMLRALRQRLASRAD